MEMQVHSSQPASSRPQPASGTDNAAQFADWASASPHPKPGPKGASSAVVRVFTLVFMANSTLGSDREKKKRAPGRTILLLKFVWKALGLEAPPATGPSGALQANTNSPFSPPWQGDSLTALHHKIKQCPVVPRPRTHTPLHLHLHLRQTYPHPPLAPASAQSHLTCNGQVSNRFPKVFPPELLLPTLQFGLKAASYLQWTLELLPLAGCWLGTYTQSFPAVYKVCTTEPRTATATSRAALKMGLSSRACRKPTEPRPGARSPDDRAQGSREVAPSCCSNTRPRLERWECTKPGLWWCKRPS